MIWLRRALGAFLVVFVFVPVFRLLGSAEMASFQAASLAAAEANLDVGIWGTLVFVLGGALVAFLLPGDGLRRAARSLADRLSAVPPPTFALGIGLFAAIASAAAGQVLFRGIASNVDEIASLIHARYLAEGMLAGPVGDSPGAWLIPNMLLVDAGWLSQYPPMHLVLLAAGYKVGAVWLVGPVLTGITVGVVALLADRLLADDPGVARVGSVLVGLSPFLLLLGGGYLSHVSALTFATLALYLALRAAEGGAWWAVPAGVAVGAFVTSRPWTGLVMGAAFTAGLWVFHAVRQGEAAGWLARRLAGVTLGGLPFAVGLALFDSRLFGHPLSMGYSVANGPSHGLGFHNDPWGSPYGPLEAVAYTSSSLIALGIHLLETPIPLVALVALFLVVADRLLPGQRVLLAWALLPVATNALYWHHGVHLGPRMLYEATPAWVLLGAVAVTRLTRAPPGRGRLNLPDMLSWAVACSLLVAPLFALQRARSYAWTDEALARIVAPEIPGVETPLVFVHTSWSERIASTLQGTGMTQDSVNSVLRRNDVCEVYRFAYARAGALPATETTPPPATLDFQRIPSSPGRLQLVELVPGTPVRLDPALEPTASCRREAGADRMGSVALAPLLWQGDLPGIDGNGALFVRDRGPAENRRLLQRFPDRPPFVYVPTRPESPPALQGYDEAMEMLWGVDEQGPR